MSQLILKTAQGEYSYYLNQTLTTIGPESLHDIVVPAEGAQGITFSVVQNGARWEVVPAKTKLQLNGDRIKRQTPLSSCDRIEWDDNIAVFLESPIPVGAQITDQRDSGAIQILQNISSSIQQQPDFSNAFQILLKALIELSGAEDGTIVAALDDAKGWKVMATSKTEQTPRAQRKALFSNSILKDALEKRQPIYLESTIGNEAALAESVIEGKIFSVACFPLIFDQKIFGAVFLHTRQPGKVIKKESLAEISVLATQTVFLLLSSSELEKVREENQTLLKQTKSESPSMIYKSKSMADVATKIQKLAKAPLDVILFGETGTGKEVCAKEVHRLSPRAKGPFIAVNCAAIPASLLESLLFGHEKGAFTGADKAQKGKFELANKGTLFLDEIGELSMDLQAKLLRVIQERKVEKLGSSQQVPIDVRIVSASHQDLTQKDKFRQDLYYRLNGMTIELPPLRKRKEDIPTLSSHFIDSARPGVQISAEAMKQLQNYAWPGNVRELKQVITRAAHLCDQDTIETSDLELQITDVDFDTDNESFSWEEFENLDKAQIEFTKRFVQRGLERNGGNRQQTAKKLGISERTLYRILASLSDADSGSES